LVSEREEQQKQTQNVVRNAVNVSRLLDGLRKKTVRWLAERKSPGSHEKVCC
jgi:predicted ribonuclease YlaK